MHRHGHIALRVVLVIAVCVPDSSHGQSGIEKELHPQNGFYNNLFEPEWGTTGNELLRSAQASYSDQVYEPNQQGRPNPLDISQALHAAGSSGDASTSGKNAMLVYFGQLVADEIVNARSAGCPPEYDNIRVPAGHLYRDASEEMVFKRAGYNQRTGISPNYPRQQQNGVTPYLDAGFLYGTTRFWTNAIREFSGGRLKRLSPAGVKNSFPALNADRLPLYNPPVPRDHSLREASRFFLMGNTRGHENPFLLSLQIIWFRWHNHLADEISRTNTTLTDEQVFEEARRRVIAHFQKIVVKEWLPRYLGPGPDKPAYKGYNPRVHPGVTQEFAMAAMKYGHTLVPAGVWTISDTCTETATSDQGAQGETRPVQAIRLCNTYWDSQDLVQQNIDSIVRGMALTQAKADNPTYVPDLREYLYGPYEFSRQDLAALDIQRSRDHGLASFNSVRQALNMSSATTWRDVTNDARLQDSLRAVYGNKSFSDDLDLITGGLLETRGSGPGQLFSVIIQDQFQRIIDGDRFWYENTRNGLFTQDEIRQINSVTFRQILLNVTNIQPNNLPSDSFSCRGNVTCNCRPPPNVDDNNSTMFGVCSKLQTYDFFSGSEASFALSILATGLTIPGSIGILLMLVWLRKRREARRNMSRPRKTDKTNTFAACEWLGPESGKRNVTVEFINQRKKIKVKDMRGKDLRFIDLRNTEKATLRLSYDKRLDLLSLRVPGEVDLILRFGHLGERQEMLQYTEEFLQSLGVQTERQEQPELIILSHSNNKDDRQKLLDKFFRVVCLQALKKDPTAERWDFDDDAANDVIKLKLTRTEFAESLGMQASSIFIRNVFLLADTNNDGFLSFKEFLDLFAVFARGTAEQKAQMMFNIYDIRRRGYLTREDFFKMIRSLLDLSDASLDNTNVTNLMEVMFRDAGIADKDTMSFEDFKKVFVSKEYESTLHAASIADGGALSKHTKEESPLKGRRKTFIQSYRGAKEGGRQLNRQASRVRAPVRKQKYPGTPLAQRWYAFSRYVETYQCHIFWLCLYTLVCVGIFTERAYYYAVGREHAGLRRLSGAWTTAMIRGSASVIMFNLASLLVTMSRNTITRLRETFVHRFVPFDSAVSFHKYIAAVLMIASIVHIVGHCVNLYCMSTQPAQDLSCLFREFFRASHVLYTFHFWAFQTITGLAGILVTVVMFIMYVFAIQFARRNVFNAFWFTHSFYIFLYILTFMHGIGRLVQDPLFPWYLIGPLLVYLVDRTLTYSRHKVEIIVKKAELLPSAVIFLEFKRPANFDYKSGQWVRIACLNLGKSEYHPFTLTSAPHEENLSLHIRAVGPWTSNLRETYDPSNLDMNKLPKLYLDGPFGEGHQDWYTFDIAVLVGGGIGVTPFASILKDIAFKSQTGARFTCKKVYFVWVTRTQKHYEWLVDIIRDVENKDKHNIVSVHIFVTQFQQKFDLRTTMLYICERHFQKVENRSLLTGLRAVTHFGRPEFDEFLNSLHYEHPQVRRVGVFSCGPGPMTNSVQAACSYLNTLEGPSYTHHFENF
ncbi:dual oxidase 2-like [Haliotis cracherodii]|uniref:dual oxidase 2-like n=1 Tax=Haliotis cracherodii TaxID=6455 RepID=UPI0039E9C1CC